MRHDMTQDDRKAPGPAPSLTPEQFRELVKGVSVLLNAIGDGTITIDGGSVWSPTDRRHTIKELRALSNLTQAPQQREAPSRVQALTPRVVYSLIPHETVVDGGDLSPSAVAILKYLTNHPNTTIRELVTELHLKRSTVANVLTMLRKRELVKSTAIEG